MQKPAGMRLVARFGIFFALASPACGPPDAATPTDTCTPAGGTCVRTDAPMGASSPGEAACVDYGVWNGSAPYDARDDLSCTSVEDCSVRGAAFMPPPGSPSRCRSSKRVCCFERK
jgi:hypothetical protein